MAPASFAIPATVPNSPVQALLKMEADSRAAVEEGEEVTTGQGLVDLNSRASKGGKGGCDSMC